MIPCLFAQVYSPLNHNVRVPIATMTSFAVADAQEASNSRVLPDELLVNIVQATIDTFSLKILEGAITATKLERCMESGIRSRGQDLMLLPVNVARRERETATAADLAQAYLYRSTTETLTNVAHSIARDRSA